MLDVVVVNRHGVLEGGDVAIGLDAQRHLVAFVNGAGTHQVADELLQLARGAKDRHLVINDDVQTSHGHVPLARADTDTTATPGDVATSDERVGAEGQHADLLEIGRHQGVHGDGRHRRLTLTKQVAGLDDVGGGEVVVRIGTSGDCHGQVVGGVERTSSAEETFKLRDQLGGLLLRQVVSELSSEVPQRVFATGELAQVICSEHEATVGDRGVLRAGSDLLSGEVTST